MNLAPMRYSSAATRIPMPASRTHTGITLEMVGPGGWVSDRSCVIGVNNLSAWRKQTLRETGARLIPNTVRKITRRRAGNANPAALTTLTTGQPEATYRGWLRGCAARDARRSNVSKAGSPVVFSPHLDETSCD